MVLSGNACQRHATKPAAIGHENDVPFIDWSVPSYFAATTLNPNALTLGFTRPSALGPKDVNSAASMAISTAPTARTLSPSAGAVMYFHELLPSLPALLTTSKPF